VDYLRGLKENVIIGRLIPARYDMSEEGRARLGMDEPPPEPVGIFSRPAQRLDAFGLEDDPMEGFPSL
jgi:hypothetical protein